MRVLVGLDFTGATLTERDDLSLGDASIGQVTWRPAQLLRDLELRLGLGVKLEPQALRVARWQARLAAVAPQGRYCSRSFEVDPLGTAAALLGLRDVLVEAGWAGEPIAGGGRRLDVISELERSTASRLPLGMADRLAVVEQALAAFPVSVYSELSLAEPIELWPARWQSVFRRLERCGARLTRLQVNLPGARTDTDLGALQAVLAGSVSHRPIRIQGDGSLVALTAETSGEAARAAAAVMAELPRERTVVIREREAAALDGALQAHRLRTQGVSSSTPWRSAAQVLPLALELSFEPKDPYRVLELLTLPIGPFQGYVGHALARTLADAPGIGGARWRAAKAKLASGETASGYERQLAAVESWLETSGADAVSGASKAALLAVVERVRDWILSRIPGAPDDVTLLIAAQHTNAISSALVSDTRETLGLVAVRKLVASVLSVGTAVDLIPEEAGGFDHVVSPACLLTPREIVIWWAFNDGFEGARRLAWRQPELSALRQAGIQFPDPRLLLAERARAARRALTCATEQVILISASHVAGVPQGSHPLWDEIVARANLDDSAIARLVVSARQLLDPSASVTSLRRPSLTPCSSLELPGGQLEWTTPEGAVPAIEHLSHTKLDALLGCPLRWVLSYGAATNPGGHALPPLFQLSGLLGHRLFELLHEQGAFEGSEHELRERAERVLGELFEREGALFLRPGMTFERTQLERQLVGSVVQLAGALRGAGLRIVAVEQPIDVAYRDGKLEGRIDLLVAHDEGAFAIIDMKWGLAHYRDGLESGQALQLALYAHAHATERGTPDLPDAAYFSLKDGRLVGLASSILPNTDVVSGPTLADTWQRAERSLRHAASSIQRGRFPVTGLRRSLPLLSALGVPVAEHAGHFMHARDASCQYCHFDALCGRRWEVAS